MFCVFFPSPCRICSAPLAHARRLPVCESCLRAGEPIAVEDFCARCGRAAPGGLQPCAECRLQPPDYDSARSLAHYQAVPRGLVHLLKYGKVLAVADFIADQLERLPLPPADLVVPVPLGRRRRRQRGFNQSERIARPLARRRSLPCRPDSLLRRKDTPPQAGLSAEQRAANLRGAFRAHARRVAGQRVLLVDDVLTTGATACACARALKSAGAREVHLVTFARADLRRLSGEVAVAAAPRL